MTSQRWGDDVFDDSSDEEVDKSSDMFDKGGPGAEAMEIPPTHKSRIDKAGIQIVTSYRQNPNNPKQLLKTIQKVKISTEKVKEPKAVEERKKWTKFGQAALQTEGADDPTTVQSKDEIFLDDPNADTDLQDEDPTKAIAGNLNEFWAKQKRRALERKYDLGGGEQEGAEGVGGGLQAAGATPDAGGGWTQVVAGRGAAAAGPGGPSPAKYVPPSQRMGAAGAAAGAGGPGAYQRRAEDLNTIRVTNLSESTTEADLQDLFQRYGRISRVYLAKDKETLQSRGFAFVSFVNMEDAARAMEELQGYGYDHLILKLEWARPNQPKDPATSGTEFRSGYGKALAQDTKAKVSYASNLTK